MPGLVNLTDVKQYLNIQGTGNDAELAGFLMDATSAIEDVIGPIAARTVVDTYDAHTARIVLSQTPVISVESVSIQPWLGAAAIDDTAAWQANTNTGVLRRLLVGGSMPFYGQGSVFTVTYTVGRASVPNPVNRAVLMQVAMMWRSQRGAMAMPAGGDDGPAPYPGSFGFLSPGVMELLVPYLPPPGVA